ncbi:MAG: hypothetical protein AAF502_00570 [Bacteroidota bacterium]
MTTKIYLYSIIIVSIFVFACKDFDLDEIQDETQYLRLNSTTQLGHVETGFYFEYDSSGHLSSFKRAFEDEYTIQKEVITNEDGYVESIVDCPINSNATGPATDTSLVIYEGSLIKKITYVNQYGYPNYFEFTYDSDNRIKTLRHITGAFGENAFKEYAFTYTGNNVTRIDEHRNNDGVISQEIYTLLKYDNNPNPYILLDEKYYPFLLDWIRHYPISENNVIEVKRQFLGEDEPQFGSIKNYIYGAGGYPETSYLLDPEIIDILYSYE